MYFCTVSPEAVETTMFTVPVAQAAVGLTEGATVFNPAVRALIFTPVEEVVSITQDPDL